MGKPKIVHQSDDWQESACLSFYLPGSLPSLSPISHLPPPNELTTQLQENSHANTTRQPDHIVPVKVTVRLDPTSTLVDQFGGRRFVCCVAEDGTLADLRVVLVRDKVIDKDDGPIFVFDGGVVGNSSESHIKWNFLVKVRPDTVFL